jgi:hypothetical protein
MQTPTLRRHGSSVLPLFTAGLLLLLLPTVAFAQYTVTAAWDRNTDTRTAGYRLYYGTSPGTYPWSVDAGNQISVPLNLSSGRYYFTVRAYNSSYQYGPPSPEVTFSVGTSTSSPTALIRASLLTSTSAIVGWATRYATTVTLNGVPVPASGNMTVTLTSTRTFTVVATGANGQRVTASTTLP